MYCFQKFFISSYHQVDNGNADACALACAAKQKCTFFVVEENKSCALLGGAVTGFEKDAKKKTTYAKECAGGKIIDS